MIIDPADRGDHCAAAHKRDREIAVDPVKNRGKDDSAERRKRDRESATARCRDGVRTSLVRNVEQPVEGIEPHATGEKPAKNRGGNEESCELNRQLPAPDALYHSAVRDIPL